MIEVQKPLPGQMKHMKWSGYAGRQQSGDYAGDTPVKAFYKNYCSTAMHSLNTSDGVSTCDGVRFLTEHYNDDIRLVPVPSVAPPPNPAMEMYYPNLSGNRYPTVCNPDAKNTDANACTGPYDESTGANNNDAKNVVKRCNNADPKDCGIRSTGQRRISRRYGCAHRDGFCWTTALSAMCRMAG